MARTIVAGQCAFGQSDFFESGHRKQGLTWNDIRVNAFFNGAMIAWPLADGSFVSDASVGSGAVYFNEVFGAPGFYLIRFFPDRVGFWRIVLSHSIYGESICEFDAIPSVAPAQGLTASFRR